MGDGNKILQLDLLHPDGVLRQRCGHRAYDAASQVESNLASVHKDKFWIWRLARSD